MINWGETAVHPLISDRIAVEIIKLLENRSTLKLNIPCNTHAVERFVKEVTQTLLTAAKDEERH